jgi:hypothetical protein
MAYTRHKLGDDDGVWDGVRLPAWVVALCCWLCALLFITLLACVLL